MEIYAPRNPSVSTAGDDGPAPNKPGPETDA
jgi:hypothetical protein